ncbi:hypothetical protein GGI42DRAFT_337456 [Trichoderma sp. SZMC 28013]
MSHVPRSELVWPAGASSAMSFHLFISGVIATKLPRSSTLNLVAVFSIIRIIACSAQITATATSWDTADRISVVAGCFSASLLLLTKSDLLSRV